MAFGSVVRYHTLWGWIVEQNCSSLSQEVKEKKRQAQPLLQDVPPMTDWPPTRLHSPRPTASQRGHPRNKACDTQASEDMCDSSYSTFLRWVVSCFPPACVREKETHYEKSQRHTPVPWCQRHNLGHSFVYVNHSSNASSCAGFLCRTHTHHGSVAWTF